MKKKRLLWIVALAAIAVTALVLALTLPGKKSEIQTGNLLTNGDFSADMDGWYTDAYITMPGYTDYSVADGVATITNHALNDARFVQEVAVQPDSLYCLRGYIRADASDGLGANLSISGIYVFSECVYDTEGEWQEVRLYGRTGESQRSVTIFARLGGYSGEAIGTASFRDITLEQIASVPDGYIASSWTRATANTSTATDEETSAPAWPYLLAVALGYALVCLLLRRAALGEGMLKRPSLWMLLPLLAAAFAARVLVAVLVPGYGVDIGCFSSWANTMVEVGPANFYNAAGFCDYPPGYLLVLGLFGQIGKLLGTGVTTLLVKMPSILCDIAAAAVLYTYGRKRVSERAAFTVAALYALNPLTFITGAAWGQSDSVMALCILLVVVLAIERKWAWTLPVYMLAVLMKPQALMFGPLGLLALIVEWIRNRDRMLVRQTLIGLAGAAVVALAVVVPFSVYQTEPGWLISLYTGTMSYYASATVNACNLYFLFGQNWVSVEESAPVLIRLLGMVCLCGGAAFAAVRFRWDRTHRAYLAVTAALLLAGLICAVVPMSYAAFGWAVIALAVVLCALVYLAGGSIRHLPLLGALLLMLLCSVGTMMHERYLFPAAVLLALACLLERDRRVYILFVLLSLSVFLNVGVVLDRGVRIGDASGHLSAPLFGIVSDSAWLEYAVSALNCVLACWAGYVCAAVCCQGQTVLFAAPAPEKAEDVPQTGVRPSAAMRRVLEPKTLPRMIWLDYALMLGVTVIYAVAAFTNLGATKSPQTCWRSAYANDQHEDVVLDLGETRQFNMLYMSGIHSVNSDFIVRVSQDGETWSEANWAELGGEYGNDCFKWYYLCQSYDGGGSRTYSTTPLTLAGRYVCIEAQYIGTTIYETIFRDPATQEIFPVTLVSGNGEALIDEQDTFTGEPGWYNSTYFDEIYHARTGYEHYLAMQGDYTYRPYETSHPPLGKVLIAFSISVFGMTPFGWRFAGALAGVLMLPGMYLLGRLLTKRRMGAFAAMFLMAVDCMHFTQTRIATIDSFVVLFIIWSYVFMVYYLRMDYWRKPLIKTLVPLALSGLSMGLAVASKWTGCYAGVGLAVLFFWSVWRRFREHLAASHELEAYEASQQKVNHKLRNPHPEESKLAVPARTYPARLLITLGCCLVFFIAVPLGVYYASYIPYFLPSGGITVQKVIQAAVGDYLTTGVFGGMFGYHSTPGLGMNHPFYSPWYEWPVIGKPMWYYSASYHAEGSTQTIMALGNPAVWWGGLAALIMVIVIWAERHIDRRGLRWQSRGDDMRPAILLISFAAQYMPWVLVPRGTYIYHYFAAVPFIILCAALCFDLLADTAESYAEMPAIAARPRLSASLRRAPAGLMIVYLAIALALFIAFFPYASGITASTKWLSAMQWFRSWLYY